MANNQPLNGSKAKEVRSNVNAKMAQLANRLLGKANAKSVPDDPVFAETFPNVWEWCAATQIGESIGKDPARLAFQISDGCWKLTLTDNALQCSLTAIGLTFDAALQTLERLMMDSNAPWVQFKKKGKALREITREEKKTLDK